MELAVRFACFLNRSLTEPQHHFIDMLQKLDVSIFGKLMIKSAQHIDHSLVVGVREHLQFLAGLPA